MGARQTPPPPEQVLKGIAVRKLNAAKRSEARAERLRAEAAGLLARYHTAMAEQAAEQASA
jgi:hypothetical protein